MTIKQLATQSTTWISVKFSESTGLLYNRLTKAELTQDEEETEKVDRLAAEVAIAGGLCHRATSALNAMSRDTGKSTHYSIYISERVFMLPNQI